MRSAMLLASWFSFYLTSQIWVAADANGPHSVCFPQLPACLEYCSSVFWMLSSNSHKCQRRSECEYCQDLFHEPSTSVTCHQLHVYKCRSVKQNKLNAISIGRNQSSVDLCHSTLKLSQPIPLEGSRSTDLELAWKWELVRAGSNRYCVLGGIYAPRTDTSLPVADGILVQR